MIETNTSEAVRRGAPLFPWLQRPSDALHRPSLRRRLNFAGGFFVALDVAVTWMDLNVPALPVALWVVATICFVGSFIVTMSEAEPAPTAAAPKVQDGKDAAPIADQPAEPAEARAEAEKASDAEGAADEASASGEDEPPLIRRGNPLRPLRGGVTALVASIIALVLMGREGQLRFGVPLGLLFVVVASWGVMDFLGTFDDPEDRVARSTPIGDLARPIAICVGAWLAFVLALAFAASGLLLPQRAWGFVVTAAFIGGAAGFFDVGTKLGVYAREGEGAEPVWKHYGFWLVAIAAALYFPLMGTSSLWDPWETHYGEVSREILARDDWISLWWAQDGWFWSKPVLDMWLQAIAMATLGVHYQPDKMLIGNGTQPTMHPEWAVRAPVVLVTILGMYVLYKGVAKSFGKRAAFLGGLVLATMPDWYMLAHQTMTDMPFVATMTASLGFVLLGLRADENAEVRAFEVVVAKRRFRLTAWHLVIGVVLVSALPQILYLLSRNVAFLWRPGARGFNPHWDEFRSGSGMGNCGLPGNEDCKATMPAFIPHAVANPTNVVGYLWRAFGAFEPAVQALAWAALLGFALYLCWGERRVRRLFYLAAWYFAAVSTLGKGPAGFGIPVLVALAYLAASRPEQDLVPRIQRLVREIAQFEIVAGLIVLLVVGLPWYVAMYVRHGPPFTDRLIFHDMFNRAFHHVHDTNEGDDTSFRFYVWQLGYALYPWTGLAPLGLLWWLRRGRSEQANERSDAGIFLCMWFVFGFALFSFMGTKFHHYIFPVVPAVAMLIGLALDDMLGDQPLAAPDSLALYFAGLASSAALMVVGVARTQPGSFLGGKPLDGPLPPGSPPIGIVLFLAGVALFVAVIRILRPKTSSPLPPLDDDGAHQSRMIAAGGVAAAMLVLIVTRDFVLRGESADQPGAIRLLHLFTYNYRRPWPETLDFSAALLAFGAVATLLCVALAVRAYRHHVVALFCVFGVVWAVWGEDVYMDKTAQHWGQHEVIQAYYADRASPEEMLVAYQMNWKGENFYTGNHIPAFVSTGAAFTQWLKKEREAGVKVLYFITEHGRIGGLKSEVGAKSYREVTDKALCNKFVLVRAVL